MRGLGGVKLPEVFTKVVEGRGLGGVDFGFLSTTTKMDVAVSYIGDKDTPVIFEIDLGDIDRGTPLSLLSEYPGEVMPPPRSSQRRRLGGACASFLREEALDHHRMMPLAACRLMSITCPILSMLAGRDPDPTLVQY